jgi:hypothetical protein
MPRVTIWINSALLVIGCSIWTGACAQVREQSSCQSVLASRKVQNVIDDILCSNAGLVATLALERDPAASHPQKPWLQISDQTMSLSEVWKEALTVRLSGDVKTGATNAPEMKFVTQLKHDSIGLRLQIRY